MSPEIDNFLENGSFWQIPEEEQKRLVREARDEYLKKYERDLRENDRKIIFKENPEKLREPLLKAINFSYIIGDLETIRNYEDKLEKSMRECLDEDDATLRFKAYENMMENLEEGKENRNSKFKERLYEIMGDGPKYPPNEKNLEDEKE